jgi:copper chaperone NosL
MTASLSRRALLSGSAVLLLSACGGSGTSSDKPPSISFGRDVCARCGMLISDDRYAAAFTSKNPAVLFDDVGELVATAQEHGVEGLRVWVHDASSREWTDGTTAFYVARPDRATPMGTGLVAFGTEAAATSAASELGVAPMNWDRVLVDWQAPL